jgi:hypothetical protein
MQTSHFGIPANMQIKSPRMQQVQKNQSEFRKI